ncbi:uncharacterized protein BCR38DRAFT_414202 [Pseudomassariella vexata]|uniref:Uncharacterized protein n=1 Tax=Pseudomassariella vexata TaxID=1141098 RepID=A0A1Y2DDY1_9PEZI|nr:uncharacterized protein BCR38DRAFT_414202 [Pseudomassariella vexata]ORY56885.1 hypothetical protein BCR38DRAFT_414202 [Pseudomassariella vexata]
MLFIRNGVVVDPVSIAPSASDSDTTTQTWSQTLTTTAASNPYQTSPPDLRTNEPTITYAGSSTGSNISMWVAQLAKVSALSISSLTSALSSQSSSSSLATSTLSAVATATGYSTITQAYIGSVTNKNTVPPSETVQVTVVVQLSGCYTTITTGYGGKTKS